MPPHDIYRDHDMKVYICRACGQIWASTANPATDCPGLKVYYWHNWPEGLYTKTQLNQKGYKPGQPVGVMRHRDRWMPLYRLEDATPKRKPTEAQRAALAKAQVAGLAARTCQRCKAVQPSVRYIRGGLCEDCRGDDRLKGDRDEAIAWACDCLNKPFVILDTETTGLDSDAEIIQLAVIDHTGAVRIDTYIKPVQPINESGRACEVNGISNAMVADAPTFPDVWPRLLAVIAGCDVVIFNADFDRAMLYFQCNRHKLPKDALKACTWHDAMGWYSQYVGEWSNWWKNYRWQSLDDARHEFDLGFDDSHTALGDCRATMGLIKGLASKKGEPQRA